MKIEIFNSTQSITVNVRDRDCVWKLQDALHAAGANADVREYVPRLGSLVMPYEFRKMIADGCRPEVTNKLGKVPMIKMLRQMTGSGLKEAKDMVDACQQEFDAY